MSSVTNLKRQTARKGQYRAFGSGVVGKSRRANIGQLRRRINNTPTIAGVHQLQCRPRAQKRAADMDRHQAIKVGHGHLFNRTRVGNARVIAEDIESLHGNG